MNITGGITLIVWVLLILLFVVMAAGLWAITVKGQTPGRIASDKTPDIPYQNIVIPNGGAKLYGWFIDAANDLPKKPLIILVHGWGSGKSRMLRYVTPLHQAGYSLLLFDARSHGESDPEKGLTVKTFRDDVNAAVQYAKQRDDIDAERIGVIAHSFGGYGSLLANTKPIGIQALVTDSMPTRVRTFMEVPLKKYKLPYYPLGPIIFKLMTLRAGVSTREFKRLQALAAVGHQKSPVLMIHSRGDKLVPAAELEYLIERHPFDGAKLSYMFIDSDGHRSSHTDPHFWPRVLEFLEKHVGKRQSENAAIENSERSGKSTLLGAVSCD